MGFYDFNQLGKIKPLKQPYRMTMSIVHSINPDVPWVTIASVPRLPEASWPQNMKPEGKSDDKEVVIKELPFAGIQDKLRKATDYTKEEASKQFKGTMQIHVFLMADASAAKAIENEWMELTKDPTTKQRLKRSYDLMRCVNAIIIGRGDNDELVSPVRQIYYR
jgi:hypothetical protein